jgi:hypothetical protein
MAKKVKEVSGGYKTKTVFSKRWTEEYFSAEHKCTRVSQKEKGLFKKSSFIVNIQK